ncbi:MAG: 50S ribosomal protein L30 [Gammaproteobacteria bacterium]|nr:50S ribosomal protein L30 [Gammaproteobacteria bacterium]
MSDKYFTVKLTSGLSSQTQRTRATVSGLGLRKIGSFSKIKDTPANRGMFNKVKHLVIEVVE